MPRYPEALKTKMVLRMTGPRAMSAAALAQETHIPQSTLSRWLREFATLRGMNNDNPAPDHAETDAMLPDPPATHRARGAEEKLRLVALADTLGEQELGALLRREGLHAADIEAWRADMLAALTQRSKGASEATAARLDDRRRIQELERELHRKDKALAEAAALLVLQKKVRAIWEDADDDTKRGRGR
jgi:transposase-like protein